MEPLNMLISGLLGIVGLIILVALIRSVRIVPAKSALVVERLGKYAKTLDAGFHLLIPFLDKVKYKHNLKEQAEDVPSQPCFTLDNVRVYVDGVLYFKVVDPKKASYGIRDHRYATIQLAQTTMRSVIGKMDLETTFEERERVNAEIVKSVDEASDPWGVKVTRYEIQNIKVPDTILKAMELLVKSEREKRAVIERSEGDMQSRINYSAGVMEEAINWSEGEKEKAINEAEGRASEILALAEATAESIRKVADATQHEGGDKAVALQVAEDYIKKLEALARKDTNVILPMDLTDMDSIMEMINKMIYREKRK